MASGILCPCGAYWLQVYTIDWCNLVCSNWITNLHISSMSTSALEYPTAGYRSNIAIWMDDYWSSSHLIDFCARIPHIKVPLEYVMNNCWNFLADFVHLISPTSALEYPIAGYRSNIAIWMDDYWRSSHLIDFGTRRPNNRVPLKCCNLNGLLLEFISSDRHLRSNTRH